MRRAIIRISGFVSLTTHYLSEVPLSLWLSLFDLYDMVPQRNRRHCIRQHSPLGGAQGPQHTTVHKRSCGRRWRQSVSFNYAWDGQKYISSQIGLGFQRYASAAQLRRNQVFLIIRMNIWFFHEITRSILSMMEALDHHFPELIHDTVSPHSRHANHHLFFLIVETWKSRF